jgi:hypothetical protein
VRPFDRRQNSFKMDEITYLDRKTLFLDRMLLSLFERLRFDGRSVVHKGRRAFDPPGLAARMAKDPVRFPGFQGREDLAEAWLRSDLLDLMNRGKGVRETLVGPRPFHLNAYKATNSKSVNDWGAAAQVWAMLYHADRPLLAELRTFFGPGLDFDSDTYDGHTDLDIETLAILGIVDGVQVMASPSPAPEPLEPLCLAQGRLLADDLRRLLAYRDVIPRLALANHARTVFGLHLALYQLRLFRLLPSWVAAAERADPGSGCSVDGQLEPALSCPFSLPITLDATEQVTSQAGQLARRSADAQFASIPDYVRAVLLLNRVRDFAATQARLGNLAPPKKVADLLAILRAPPPDMEGWFQARIGDAVAGQDADEAEDPIVVDLLRMPGSAINKYVELICLQRMRQEHSQLVRLVDSLGQKNRDGGFIRQNPGVKAPRWFSLDSHLLETLIHVALVDRPGPSPRTRPLLLQDFLTWLRERYGFEIYAPSYRQVLPEEQEGWQQNQAAFRERLHQIGFFADLSDAFNSQTIRPRYHLSSDD